MITRAQTWLVGLVAVTALAGPAPVTAQTESRSRAAWVALAQGGFVVPAGASAAALLVEMNGLLASPDPVLRDDVAYAAAEKWIVRDRVVAPDDLRRLVSLWSGNLDDGLGTAGDDRIFKRSFSALCLSLVAAREAATPFLTATEAQQLFARLLDYFARERDVRGFDAERGWMHAVAHTADAFKFLARGPQWTPADLTRLLAAVRARLTTHDAVFTWGESERLAAALQAAMRRPDADGAVVAAWLARWPDDHRALWAHGPLVEPAAFARVENAKQVLRSLHALLALDASPTPSGDTARRATLAALAGMR